MHLGADERGKLRQDHVITSRFAHPCPSSCSLDACHQSPAFFPALSKWLPLAPRLISFKPTGPYTCRPMRALGIETQNLCGIPELQTYSKAIWLGRFSDYQMGKQECHGPVGGHGDIHQKHSSRETAVSLFPWRGTEPGCVCMRVSEDEHVYKPKLLSQRNHFPRFSARKGQRNARPKIFTRQKRAPQLNVNREGSGSRFPLAE